MNLLVRVYIAAGFAFVLSAYVIILSLWFDATLNGLFNGQYAVAVDTNALGENDIVLLLLFLFLPAVTWMFTRGLRRVIKQEAPL